MSTQISTIPVEITTGPAEDPERVKLRNFITTHDRSLSLTRTSDGARFDCPECGQPAAAALTMGHFWVTHTLKSGVLPQWADYAGSCPLADRGSHEINAPMLPTNPPVRVASGPTPLAGALKLRKGAAKEAPDWLVDGILARGDYASLFGPSEVGKSLLVLDWSLRMARKGVRVLYLDRENGGDITTARLDEMGAEEEDMDALAVLCFPDLPDLATREGAAVLADLAAQHQADLVVLDTISKFSEVGQAAQADRWTAIYNRSLMPLLAAGTAVIQLDHTGYEGTRERDSSAKRQNVAVAYALMPGRKPGALTLTRVKNRPNYPGDAVTALHRVTDPVLTHTTGERVDPKIMDALAELEKAKVPLSAGRDAARAMLPEGTSIRNEVLAAAIRLRKAELEG